MGAASQGEQRVKAYLVLFSDGEADTIFASDEEMYERLLQQMVEESGAEALIVYELAGQVVMDNSELVTMMMGDLSDSTESAG
jgi:hypothetical protein